MKKHITNSYMRGIIWGGIAGGYFTALLIFGLNMGVQEITFSWLLYILWDQRLLFFCGSALGILIGIICCLLPVSERIFRYRYLLAAILFICLVAGKVHGSSIGYFTYFLDGDDGGIFAGTLRSMRSDEWATLTPLCIAQENNPLGEWNRYGLSVNNALTDNFIVYGQPAWDILMLFRPFYWGYLFLGSSYGLSWFWCGRQIALLLSAFELGMILTNKNKKISSFLAVAIGYAPFVQWWFAINGLAEMLIFGSYFLVGVNYLLTREYSLKKYAAAVGMAVCAGGYIMTFYPTWMVPVAYGFLPIFLWLLFRKKERKQVKKDAFCWIIFLAVFAAGMLRLFLTSLDTIEAVSNSVYPGILKGMGGGGTWWMGKYPFSFFSWFYNKIHIVENSSVICFAPIGLILSVWVMCKQKKGDLLLIFALATELLLTYYYCHGMNPTISKLLLLSFTGGNRGPQMIGFLRLFILVRALSLMKKRFHPAAAIITAFLGAAIACAYSWGYTQYDTSNCRYEYWENPLKLLTAAVILAVIFYLFLRYRADAAERKGNFSLAAASALILASSVWVNPVSAGKGTEMITEHPFVSEIEKLAESDPDGTWLMLNITYPYSNLAHIAGAVCVNTSQTYPVLERWKSIDPSGEWEEYYNRYAHVETRLGEELSFELLNLDHIDVTLNEQAARTLGIRYVITQGEAVSESWSGWNLSAEKIYEYGNFAIWKWEYR